MRRTIFIIVCICIVGFYGDLNAQIPEGAQFQPGSYMVPYRSVMRPVASPAFEGTILNMEETLDALGNNTEEADDSTT